MNRTMPIDYFTAHGSVQILYQKADIMQETH